MGRPDRSIIAAGLLLLAAPAAFATPLRVRAAHPVPQQVPAAPPGGLTISIHDLSSPGRLEGDLTRIARAAQALAGRWRLTSAPIRFDLVVVGAGWLPRHERGAWFDDRIGA